MVARAGAILRHIDPIHPACSALRIANAPAAPLSPPQTSRQAEVALRAVGVEELRRLRKGSQRFFLGGQGGLKARISDSICPEMTGERHGQNSQKMMRHYHTRLFFESQKH